MQQASKNLRAFFGVEAVDVWSYYRDIQRAQRSIAIYKIVMETLRKDLKAETERRGTLVRLRSNEVTEVKEKLEAVEKRRNEIRRHRREESSRVNNLFTRFEIHIRAIFGSQETVEKIREELKEGEKEEAKLIKEISKIGDELANAVFKQNAAVDPIEDLEFALEYLDEAIEDCYARQAGCKDKIYGMITQKCMAGGPLHLELFSLLGIKVKSPENFAVLYLKIHDISLRLLSEGRSMNVEEPEELLQLIAGGVERRSFGVQGNVKLDGSGSHHRKVRRGKNRVWREFDVTFSGSTSVTMNFDQKYYELKQAHLALQEALEYELKAGRNVKIGNLNVDRKAGLAELKKWSAKLFDMLISS